MLNSGGFFASCFLNKEFGLEILHNGIKIISIKGKIFDLHTSPSNYSTQQDSK